MIYQNYEKKFYKFPQQQHSTDDDGRSTLREEKNF